MADTVATMRPQAHAQPKPNAIRRRQPRQRLETLNGTGPDKPGPQIPGKMASRRVQEAVDPSTCTHPNTQVQANTRTCTRCFAVINQSEIVVDELEFTALANGGAGVAGSMVRDDQRFANTMGGQMRGVDTPASREQTKQRGHDLIDNLCASIGIPHDSVVIKSAKSYFSLTLNYRFGPGRRVRNVAACCIYFAARKNHTVRGSSILLMDLAERINVNVFELGHTYKDLLKNLGENDPADAPGTYRNLFQQMEPLVQKFCSKLEFGERESNKVANDALKLLVRMKRDWMVQGRQPAGIIGACIILAARMNNFRRTVREVVYVVRVADSTLHQRLWEFRQTQAAGLSVEQFREYGAELATKIVPPSMYKPKMKEYKKRKRAAIDAGEEWHSDEETPNSTATVPIEEETPAVAAPARKRRKANKGTVLPTPPNTQTQSQESSQSQSQSQSRSQTRRDSEGFTIPPVPGIEDLMNDDTGTSLDELVAAHGEVFQDDDVDMEDDQPEEPVQKPKRGRPPKPRQQIAVAQEELELEEYIEEGTRDVLNGFYEKFLEFEKNPDHTLLVKAFQNAERLSKEYMPEPITPNDKLNDEEIGEDEFEDDPDVRDCRNTAEEAAIKERVWVTENEDWLRRQQLKMLQKELDAASGKKKKPKQTRKHVQMGDGSVLQGQDISKPGDAAKAMFNKRGQNKQMSSHIDYNNLYKYVPRMLAGQSGPSSSSGNGEGSSQGATPSATAGASPEAEGTPANADSPDDSASPVDDPVAAVARAIAAREKRDAEQAASMGKGKEKAVEDDEDAEGDEDEEDAYQRPTYDEDFEDPNDYRDEEEDFRNDDYDEEF